LSAFIALSLFVLSVDFSFCRDSLGGGFRGLRLLGSEFRITALDFDKAGGFCILIPFRAFHGFRFLGRPPCTREL